LKHSSANIEVTGSDGSLTYRSFRGHQAVNIGMFVPT